MQTYEILVKSRAVYANSKDTSIVRTSVGIDQVHVLFDDPEWLGFPVTITFSNSNDDVSVTSTLPLVATGSDEWVAEATVLVPYEVIEMVGSVRVTLQGTDSSGRHIITARGAPLSVEEAGDVIEGTPPSDSPSLDQWSQAYADAVTAANDARTAAAMVTDGIGSILADAQALLEGTISSSIRPATRDTLGIVRVGDNLSITDDGVLSAIVPRTDDDEGEASALTDNESSLLYNLQLLAVYAFDSEFVDGELQDGVTVKEAALPVATVDTLGISRPDGATITIGDDGALHVPYVTHSWDGTVLTLTSASGSSSADLIGPQGPQGEVGPQGPQGPSGYVLTDSDKDDISNLILERYGFGDATRY